MLIKIRFAFTCFELSFEMLYSETSIQRTPSEPSQVSAWKRFVFIAQCLWTINIQLLFCTVIKFHVVKEAIQSSSPLPFIINFHLFVNAKTLTYYSTYFKDVIQPIQYYVLLSIQSGIRLIEVLTIEISQIQLNSSARVRLKYRGVRWIGVRYEGKY